MRIHPTPRLAVLIGLGYVVMFIGLSWALGGSMADLGSAAAVRPFVLALAIGALVLTMLATWLGWWPAVLHDEHRLGGIVRAAPVVWVVVIGIALVLGQAWTLPGDRLAWTIALAILVGFAEEVAYRGLVLVGLRATMTEGRAFLVMTLLFAVLHTPNMLLGAPPAGALVQTVLAFLGGTGLYLIRRTTGSIIPAILLHSAWDLAAFTSTNPATGLVQLLGNGVVFVIFLVALRRVFAPMPGTVAAQPASGASDVAGAPTPGDPVAGPG